MVFHCKDIFFFLFHFLSSNEHMKPMPGWHFEGHQLLGTHHNALALLTCLWLPVLFTKSVLPAEN